MRRAPWLSGCLALAPLLIGCRGEPVTSDAAVRVAVAANFVGTEAELVNLFEARTGFRVETSSGSSGQLYAQIRNGAPFDVFLSADDERPRSLEQEGRTVAGSRFTYALGRLVLYGPKLDSVVAGGRDLVEGTVTHLAVANPDTAPYGAAAMDALESLGLLEQVRPRIVKAESVTQVFQFVSAGSAEMGLLALAQVLKEPPGSYWILPEDLYRPIVQDAVLLRDGGDSEGARAFLEFLQSSEAAAVMSASGYDTAGREGEG